MSFPAYKKGTIDCMVDVDTSHVNGKSVVITGGAKGMGKEAVRAFVKAGAYVTFGDLDKENGNEVEAELGSSVKFVPCDVTSWDDQLHLFKSALSGSPNKSIDIVVANAGISGPDPLFTVEDTEEPVKPDLRIVNIDLISVMYTMKLARHYFMKHPFGPEHDRCFIMTASIVGFVDSPGIPQYTASKWGCRGLMRCLRRTTAIDGVRANIISPWYVATSILSPAVQAYCTSKGVTFAEAGDAAAAMIKIASDPSINGRSFGIVPRDIAPKGYFDIAKDDYEDDDVLEKLQDIMLHTSHRLQVRPEDQ
ncbi:hypothetical protein VTN00DRAFT_2419 [Thermoascus crustaceus]|uniref:uncharacterized protein n=1 Tax=Thermoascus crustaceus TaxID=5088 RepID=UPI003743EEC9